jgi:hypothetical protein
VKFIRAGNYVINPASIAWADLHPNDDVTVHFWVPRATTVPVSYPMGVSPPAASDHYSETFTGTVAADLKKHLLDLTGSADQPSPAGGSKGRKR